MKYNEQVFIIVPYFLKQIKIILNYLDEENENSNKIEKIKKKFNK